jgi:hypothetical protein
MQIDWKRKLFLSMLLAAVTQAQALPTELNLCLDAWHSCDQELDLSKQSTETWKNLADKALIQRDQAFSMAAKDSNPDFLGIPPLGWGIIGVVVGGATVYACSR